MQQFCGFVRSKLRSAASPQLVRRVCEGEALLRHRSGPCQASPSVRFSSARSGREGSVAPGEDGETAQPAPGGLLVDAFSAGTDGSGGGGGIGGIGLGSFAPATPASANAAGGPRPGPFVGFTLNPGLMSGSLSIGAGTVSGGAGAGSGGAATGTAGVTRRGGMPSALAGAAAGAGRRGGRRGSGRPGDLQYGIVHAHCSTGNTILTLTDVGGAVKATTSSGAQGFKGSKRGTNLAAQVAAVTLGRKARLLGFSHVAVYLKGLGRGRTAVARSLRMAGVSVRKITDRTPVPHNGCRPPKKRRR